MKGDTMVCAFACAYAAAAAAAAAIACCQGVWVAPTGTESVQEGAACCATGALALALCSWPIDAPDVLQAGSAALASTRVHQSSWSCVLLTAPGATLGLTPVPCEPPSPEPNPEPEPHAFHTLFASRPLLLLLPPLGPPAVDDVLTRTGVALFWLLDIHPTGQKFFITISYANILHNFLLLLISSSIFVFSF